MDVYDLNLVPLIETVPKEGEVPEDIRHLMLRVASVRKFFVRVLEHQFYYKNPSMELLRKILKSKDPYRYIADWIPEMLCYFYDDTYNSPELKKETDENGIPMLYHYSYKWLQNMKEAYGDKPVRMFIKQEIRERELEDEVDWDEDIDDADDFEESPTNNIGGKIDTNIRDMQDNLSMMTFLSMGL